MYFENCPKIILYKLSSQIVMTDGLSERHIRYIG